MNNVPALQPFHDGWAQQQRLLLDQLRPLTLEQMQLRPAPTEYAIWQLASNMAGSRLFWFHFMLGEDHMGVEPMFPYPWEDRLDHPRSAAEIEDAFLKTWAMVESALNRWTETDLIAPRTANSWGKLVTITPAEVMWKLLTHEAHHGAEISAILRVNGLPTTLNW